MGKLLEKVKERFTGGGQTFEAALSAKVIRADGKVEHLGVISRKYVTTAFVNLLCLALQGTVGALLTFKYHDCGTGVGAENITDVALGTPYGGARAVGTQVQGTTANIYKSVGTVSFTSTLAITEHGLLSASSSVTLMDRSVFSAINVNSGDSIEFTYNLTLTAGG